MCIYIYTHFICTGRVILQGWPRRYEHYEPYDPDQTSLNTQEIRSDVNQSCSVVLFGNGSEWIVPPFFVQFAVSRSVGCCCMLASHRQYDEVYVYRGVTSCSGHRCCGFARKYATTLCVCSCSLLFVNDHVILFCSFPAKVMLVFLFRMVAFSSRSFWLHTNLLRNRHNISQNFWWSSAVCDSPKRLMHWLWLPNSRFVVKQGIPRNRQWLRGKHDDHR